MDRHGTYEYGTRLGVSYGALSLLVDLSLSGQDLGGVSHATKVGRESKNKPEFIGRNTTTRWGEPAGHFAWSQVAKLA